jgi:hypothetical protein
MPADSIARALIRLTSPVTVVGTLTALVALALSAPQPWLGWVAVGATAGFALSGSV